MLTVLLYDLMSRTDIIAYFFRKKEKKTKQHVFIHCFSLERYLQDFS